MSRKLNRRRFILSTSAMVGISGCLQNKTEISSEKNDGNELTDAGGNRNEALVNSSRDDEYRITSLNETSEEDEVLLREDEVVSDEETEKQHWVHKTSDDGTEIESLAEGEEKNSIIENSLWTFNVDGGVLSTPRIIDGWLYFGSLDNGIYGIRDEEIESGSPSDDGRCKTFGQSGYVEECPEAVGPKDPELAWSFETDDKVGSSTAIDGDRLYVGSYDGRLYCINRLTGEEIWRYNAGDSVNSSPAIDGDTVYFGSDSDNLHAVDAEDGTEKWTFETGDQVWSSPTVSDSVVYVGSYDKNLYAVDAEDGTEVWSFTGNADFCASSPAVVDGTVYVGCTDNSLYAVSADDGGKQWAFEASGPVISSPFVTTDTVYVGSLDNYLYAIDRKSGEKNWSFDTGDLLYSSPNIIDGILYTASGTSVYALDPKKGDVVKTYETTGSILSSPAVADGVLYIGTTDGYLFSFEL